MNQTRLGSLIEAFIGTCIGFIVSFSCWPVVLWIFEMPYHGGQHVGITLFYTVISVARSYVVRRWFNARLHAFSIRLAESVEK